MVPKVRSGRAVRRIMSKAPAADPRTAKRSAVPARAKATG